MNKITNLADYKAEKAEDAFLDAFTYELLANREHRLLQAVLTVHRAEILKEDCNETS